MISAIIIDDEAKNIAMLRKLLATYCTQVQVVGDATDIRTGKRLIEEAEPQLIFLDVEMPYGNGFDLLRSLPDLSASVIFITAFDHYALEAFRYAAVDYLLKPVDIELLKEAVDKVAHNITAHKLAADYETLLRNMEENNTVRREVVLTDNRFRHVVRLEDIRYIIADGSYTHVHTIERTFVTTKNLKDFEEILPSETFARIHHGHIINIGHMLRFQRGKNGAVVMDNDVVLEVSVRRREAFMRLLQSMA